MEQSDNLLKENEDYVLIPLEKDPDGWGVRFLKGQFVETVIQFGVVKLDGVEGCLKFDYEIISSPDPELTTENKNLAAEATKALAAVLVQGVEDGTVELKDGE